MKQDAITGSINLPAQPDSKPKTKRNSKKKPANDTQASDTMEEKENAA